MRMSIGWAAARFAALACALGLILPASAAFSDDSARLVRVDHYVKVKSTAPAMLGRNADIYVREVVAPGAVLRGGLGPDKVVLFVHGAGTPVEASFDADFKDYSWMAYLAQAGFDVFAMDVTGYGRSSRPAAMSDPCNLPKAQQAQFVGGLIPAACPPSFTQPISTMGSDWDEIGAVVDRLRALRHVDKVAIVAWSQGGPRSGGYAARHPDKVSRLVVLAPAYNRTGPTEAPDPLPTTPDGSMNVQSRADFIANWDRQVGCADQYEQGELDKVWSEMLASDPVGATWGPGVRRAPTVPTWGFNQAVVAKMQTPYLMISGAYDKQVPQERVRQLYADLGSTQKVFIDLACSSHNAMWEKNHLLLFKASLDWLRDGKVDGASEGMLRLGY